MTKRDVKLFATMLEWSKEVGLDYKQFINSDNGISFIEWWEAIFSRMSLEEVEIYLDIPAFPGTRENGVIHKLRDMAMAHRDRLLEAVMKGAGQHAKTERYAG
ncbi:hypothetical protein [Brevibacillus borstelensis]|uniref:hypothetical protein n=1 Tax=Brevibacillus borstelensis TaxID=45462 RepID=UPI00046A37DD|nr:hypothetical protein [Brevibacillus borstelensis]